MTKGLQPADYVHLHNHSHYSLLDGLSKVPAMVDYVKSTGMQAVAMTDHGTLSGSIEFYKEAHDKGVKPLIGMETYIAARSHTDKEPAKDKVNYHLILIAMNNRGYQNLMKLSTVANLDGFYYKPRIDHELLERYNDGLIVLSGCIGGEVGDALRQGQYEIARKTAEWYKSVFGDRYYFEVQDHGHPKHPTQWTEQTAVNEQLFTLSRELDIPCVVTCDSHYLTHADQEAHEVLLCVQTGSFLTDTNRMSLKNMELHVTDPVEIINRWGAERPDVITNTRDLAARCEVTLTLGEILIPKFPVPKGETEQSYLHTLVYQGMAFRYGGVDKAKAATLSVKEAKQTIPEDVLERAAYELDVVASMGFNGYFLIIADFINWGKDRGIVFGPGRGSAAGSIVSYALNITELDPLQYDLLFERFLNPDRISMPDVDIDIQDTRRDEVIQYCVEKYGADRVANIVTFGKMAARNAVRDVARVLQVPYAEADRLAKMIPPPVQGRHIPLATSLVESPELKTEHETNETAARVFDLATKLEGTIRNHGVHAAGVVIAPETIVNYVPLEMAQKGVIATQYSMGPIEELGLLKMDFLGLSNLTIIKNALRIIKRVYDKDIDINTIPLDDSAAYELLARGDTTGVFQLESAGMKRYLKELKPTVFDDIIAMVALYRPGPMQFIDSFIKRKHGQEQISYLHPGLENSLQNTYGILVYQEQFMQVSKEWCGFTGGQADTLRKAVGKKKIDLMRKVKKDFVKGAMEVGGAPRDIAEKFWDQLEEFANYCFNKSHAACYGLIAYQTAYLKAHYPAAFMAALMTSDYDDTDRLAIEISECQHMGIEVLPPDVAESYAEFAVVPGSDPKQGPVRFGMEGIKNVGGGAVEEIIRARSIDGGFKDLEDFFNKVNTRVVNRKALESLIKAGAFDRYGKRGQLLLNIDTMLAYSQRIQKAANSGQVDFFGNAVDAPDALKPQIVLLETTEEPKVPEMLAWERELLGLYLSQHPLKAFETYLAELAMPMKELTADMDGRVAVVGGSITDMREITTKNGQKMAFVKLADLTTDIELILFPSVYQQTIGIWERDRVILARGKINGRDRQTGEPLPDVKILVDEAREVTHDQAQAYQPTGRTQKLPKAGGKGGKTAAGSGFRPSARSIAQRVYIRLISAQDQQLLQALKKVMDDNNGSTDVVLVMGPNEQKQIIKLPTGLQPTDEAIAKLREVVGADQVVIQ